MDDQNQVLNWAHLKSFSDVCTYSSISAAARRTGATQPTLSRHISLLEQQLGTRLFERDVSGMSLTASGRDLYEKVSAMSRSAAQIRPPEDEPSSHLTGNVRITASNIIAVYGLPKALLTLQEAEPLLEVEVVSSDSTENLLRREADIAIRMYRPTSGDLYCRKIGTPTIRMYAAKSYLDRQGRPSNGEELLTHCLIGYDRSTRIIDGFKKAGIAVQKSSFRFRSDDQVLCWRLVCAGYGIGFNFDFIGDADPRLGRIDLPGAEGSETVWLIAHRELKSSPRVRRVYDHLADTLKPLLAQKM